MKQKWQTMQKLMMHKYLISGFLILALSRWSIALSLINWSTHWLDIIFFFFSFFFQGSLTENSHFQEHPSHTQKFTLESCPVQTVESEQLHWNGWGLKSSAVVGRAAFTLPTQSYPAGSGIFKPPLSYDSSMYVITIQCTGLLIWLCIDKMQQNCALTASMCLYGQEMFNRVSNMKCGGLEPKHCSKNLV